MALSWQDIHLTAYREATRAHRELHLDLSQPIDPFAALAALGVVALRRPLNGAAGLYLPADPSEHSAPGVLVNVLHPASKQRYTAAHELGHHRRDHTAIIDADTEWLARSGDHGSDRERIAEAFAAWFLMPKGLVLNVVQRLDIEVGRLTAAEAYRVALDLGTSFQATVHHLGDLRLISSSQRRNLLQVTVRSIKEALGARRVADDLRRDVWHVEPTRASAEVRGLPGDVVVVDLEETPSSGYLWSIEVPPGLSLTDDEYRTADVSVLGGRGLHRFFLSIERPGSAIVHLRQTRSWSQERLGAQEVAVLADHAPAPGIVEPLQLVAVGA